nr:phosphate/phosphite/phosphonate ABC transporter substrate-binding protein [Streptomyces sp. NBC_00830]
MARSRFRFALAAALVSLLALAGCGSGSKNTGSSSSPATTVRLAVTDLQGLEQLQLEFGAFQTALEKLTGLKVQLFPVSDRTAAAAALSSDQVDMVFTGPAEYVVMKERTGALPVVAIRRSNYKSCIYTSRTSGITDLAGLKGGKVAMSDIGSTSGHLGPSQLLVDAGVTPGKDVQVLTVGDAVHEALKRGDVQAVGIGCQDYDQFMENENKADFPVLVTGPDLPPDVVVQRAGFDAQAVEKVRAAFTDHFDELLPAMLKGKDNAKYENAKVVQVTDKDYDVVRSMYQAVGVDDFTKFVGN